MARRRVIIGVMVTWLALQVLSALEGQRREPSFLYINSMR
jgi:hypothetical protein